MTPQRRAFTLIELLVVIAIIAILAAILFPVFAQAKLAAKKTATLSGMKQIGTATALYGGDFDDGYPTWSEYWYDYYAMQPYQSGTGKGLDTIDRYWDAKLYPYVKSGNPGNAATPGVGTANWGGVFRSSGSELPDTRRSIGISMGAIYEGNYAGGVPGTWYKFLTGSEVERPANVLWVGDGGSGGRLGRPHDQQGYFERWVCRENNPKPAGCPTTPGYTRDAPWRFGDKDATYVFLDSHAKAVPGDKFYPRPAKVGGNWPWPITGVGRGNLDCSMAQNFAATAAQAEFHRALAETRGVTCQLN